MSRSKLSYVRRLIVVFGLTLFAALSLSACSSSEIAEKVRNGKIPRNIACTNLGGSAVDGFTMRFTTAEGTVDVHVISKGVLKPAGPQGGTCYLLTFTDNKIGGYDGRFRDGGGKDEWQAQGQG